MSRKQMKKRKRQPDRLRQKAREIDEVAKLMGNVQRPGSWPGGRCPETAQPDVLKYDLATFIKGRHEGRIRLRRFEDNMQRGLMRMLPEVDHWVTEEFLWHGMPGDDWCPIDAWLSARRETLSAVACEQLRQWKQARLGLFQAGEVSNDTVSLREWDIDQKQPTGGSFRSIDLGIPGVNLYREHAGKVLLTYIAPWNSESGISCALGYGIMVLEARAEMLTLHVNLKSPAIVSEPLPWHSGYAAEQEFQKQWRGRDWPRWLEERLAFPFTAILHEPQKGSVRHEVTGMAPVPSSYQDSMGVYLEINEETSVIIAGASSLRPMDLTSRNARVLSEYCAFREVAGTPPALVGRPAWMTIR